jgi:hypothetical protein
MTIDTETGCSWLERLGLTPVVIQDEENPTKNKIYVETKVVWDKLFSSMKEFEQFKEGLNSCPHIKWFERIILSYNPELEIIDYQGKRAYGIRFQPVIDRAYKLERVDKCLHFIFYLVSMFITPILDKFDS